MKPVTVRQLTQLFHHHGLLDATYLRQSRGQPCLLKDEVHVIANLGLKGNRENLRQSPATNGSNDK